MLISLKCIQYIAVLIGVIVAVCMVVITRATTLRIADE